MIYHIIIFNQDKIDFLNKRIKTDSSILLKQDLGFYQ